MIEPVEASLAGLFEEPWYVIVGLVVAAFGMQFAQKKLKAAGKWPKTGDNYALDNLIWSLMLLPIAVAGGLIAHSLR